MLMLDRRLQVLIDEPRLHRLEAEARRRQVSVAVLVREAIDQTFPATSRERAEALGRILAAPRMAVTDVADLRRELDQARGRPGVRRLVVRTPAPHPARQPRRARLPVRCPQAAPPSPTSGPLSSSAHKIGYVKSGEGPSARA